MKTKRKLLPKLSVDGVVKGNATAGNFDDAARQLRVSELCSDVVHNANENFDDSPNTVISMLVSPTFVDDFRGFKRRRLREVDDEGPSQPVPDVQRLEVVADMDVDTPISDMGLEQVGVVSAICCDYLLYIEHNRIDYIRQNQNDIINEYLSGIYDAIHRGESDASDCEARLILPQSFIGGPRYMYSHYLDALAICRVHGNPSFFITYTCNLKRPKITEYMADFSLLTTTDRADIVDRVFEMKIQEFIKYLRDVQPFGKTVAVLYTIEFQKRSLPYCHTLLWIHDAARVHRDEDIDMYVSAELPSKETDHECYTIVSELMMHVPCRLACPSAPCTPNGVDYKKHFPKEYCNRTYTDKDGFVHYRRRDTSAAVLKQHVELDNRYVVPYNRELLTTFYAHINVEYYGWTMLIKYLFKYISKGTDRIDARISKRRTNTQESTNTSPIVVDEIENYLDSRYVSPMRPVGESCQELGLLEDNQKWENAMTEAACTASPAELRTLFAHILTYCQVTDTVSLWTRVWRTMSEDLPYTSSISLNITNLSRSLTDFRLRLPPEDLMYVLRNRLLMEEKSYNQKLLARERDRLLKLNAKQRQIIDLIVNACASNRQELVFVYGYGGTGNTFWWEVITEAEYGELLINKSSNTISLISLMKIGSMWWHDDGWYVSTPFDSLNDGCLGDDLGVGLGDSCITTYGSGIMRVMGGLLIRLGSNDGVNECGGLSTDGNKEQLDTACAKFKERNKTWEDNMKNGRLGDNLDVGIGDSCITTCGGRMIRVMGGLIIRRGSNDGGNECVGLGTDGNKVGGRGGEAFLNDGRLGEDLSVGLGDSCITSDGGMMRVMGGLIIRLGSNDGGNECGGLGTVGNKVGANFAMAASNGGMITSWPNSTFSFQATIGFNRYIVCSIKRNTQLANLIKETSLILWYEAPMNDRRCFETSDRTLRDVLSGPDTLFGGKSVMLGGNFIPTLPVKKGASRNEIVASSIAKSYLWHHFRLQRLTENMRLTNENMDETQKERVSTFAEWLLDIGDGSIGIPDESDPENTSWIDIPDTYRVPDDENGMANLIGFIYDDDALQHPTPQKLQEKVIVCPKNEIVDILDAKVMPTIPGRAHLYANAELSCDIITNYIGRIRAVSGIETFGSPTTQCKLRRTIDIENLSGNIIGLALWNEMATGFDMNTYTSLPQPVVIAVSSCWVSQYNGLQLSGTSVTHYYFNPDIPETYYIKQLHEQSTSTVPFLSINNKQYEDPILERTRNRFPLATLLEHYPRPEKTTNDTRRVVRTGPIKLCFNSYHAPTFTPSTY
nr:DNA helicase [Tanacetum cinerariifolium]